MAAVKVAVGLAAGALLLLYGCSTSTEPVKSVPAPAWGVDYGLYCYNTHSEGGYVPTQEELDTCIRTVMQAMRSK